MIKIGVVDDGVGIFPTLYKLKQVVPANYLALIEQSQNFATCNKNKLCFLAKNYLDFLTQQGCDCIVFSSIDLSVSAFRYAQTLTDLPIFGSEAPINHATTYTISNVLVVGSAKVKFIKQPNVLACPMTDFPHLAEQGNYKNIVEYIAKTTAEFDGKFDCIALAHSTMNLYKSCFSRVFPNVQIFDSLEGVARRLRKKYKKLCKDEWDISLIDQQGNDIQQKYSSFLQ